MKRTTEVGYTSYSFFVCIFKQTFEKSPLSWSFPNYSGDVSHKNSAGKQKYANNKLCFKYVNIAVYHSLRRGEHLMDFYLRWQGLPQPRLGMFVVLVLFPFLISFFSSWPEIFPCKYQVLDCHDLYILSKSCLLRFVFTIQLAIVFYSVVRIKQTALK